MFLRRSSSGSQKDLQDQNVDKQSMFFLIGVSVLGILIIIFYSFQASSFSLYFWYFSLGMSISGASFLFGGLIGLLFGIPRRLQGESSEERNPDPDQDSRNVRRETLYGANTNLEQISDWLTKILVGVGLTQIGEIGTILNNIGDITSEAMGNAAGSKLFSTSLFIYFSITGFLVGYLWTRFYLGRAFSEADNYALRRKLGKMEQKSLADADALRLTSQQLNSDRAHQPSLKALTQAIKRASHDTRSHIFYRAELVRKRNWLDSSTKHLMERTIPIFQALIFNDEDKRYHMNFGQLGFALKDQRKPDFQQAEEALSQAISIRGDVRLNHWHSYEFNRAICRIMLDEGFQHDRASEDDARMLIESDLRTAFEDSWIRDWGKQNQHIIRWLDINDLTFDNV